MSKKANLIVLDIETVPTMNKELAERIKMDARLKQPAQNVKKEIKLAWDTTEAIEEREQEAWKQTAVDVLLAEPVVVCAYVKYEPVSEIAQHHDSDRNEWFPEDFIWKKDENFFERIDEIDDCVTHAAYFLRETIDEQTIIVGHNISFDLAVLLNSFRRHGEVPPANFPKFINGHWRGRIYDTMRNAPNNNGLGYIKMSRLCEAYDLPPAKELLWRGIPMDGSRVLEAYLEGEYNLVRDYCLQDTKDTYGLYLKMTSYGFWGTYDQNREAERLIKEIQESEISESAKAMSILRVLQNSCMVPGLS